MAKTPDGERPRPRRRPRPKAQPSAGGVWSGRRRPPPELVAAAERDYRVARARLAVLVRVVRLLRAEGWPELEVLTDVYGTLRYADPLAAALIGAVAVADLARRPDPPARTGPGSGPVDPPHN